MVRARELRTETGNWWTIHLILLIEAIAIAVAHPGLRYTVAGSWTGELEVRASFRCAELAFIGAVAAVIFGIAFPSRGDAAIIGAGELISAAGHIRTTHLIAVIAAIVLGIAVERHRYATTGLALELVRAARRFRAVLHFVAVVETIVLAIAHPGFRDTSRNRFLKS